MADMKFTTISIPNRMSTQASITYKPNDSLSIKAILNGTKRAVYASRNTMITVHVVLNLFDGMSMQARCSLALRISIICYLEPNKCFVEPSSNKP